jgi:hypothetical protein
MTNRFAGRCETCNSSVPAGTGEAIKQGARWIVRCATCKGFAAPAATAVALVIRLWLAAGRVLCAPVARLGASFDAYLAASRTAGAGYSRQHNAQVCSLEQAPGLIDALRGANFVVDVAPELVAALQANAARAAADVTAAQGRAAVIDATLRERGLSLFPFQSFGVEWLAPRLKGILGDDMGLGKTIQALASAPMNAPILVVCPAVAKGVWVREARRFRPDLTPVSLSGRGTFRWPAVGEMVIVNYDILPHVEDPSKVKAKKKVIGAVAIERQFGRPLATGESMWERIGQVMLAQRAWWQAFHNAWEGIGLRHVAKDVLATVPAGCVIIADEAHALKSAKAARTQRFRALKQAALGNGGRAWVLTATPILNRPQELWAMVSALDATREVFGSWERYLQLWNAYEGRFGIEWGAPTPALAEALKSIMLRRKKIDVLPQLPAKTVRDVEVNGLSDSVTKICDEALAYLNEAGIDTAAALETALATAQKTPGFRTFSKARAALAMVKLGSALEMIDSFEDADEPIVVFSAHRDPIDALGAREGWAIITGDTPTEARTAIEDAFQRGELKGIAGTIKAAGVAITLTKASNALFIDEEWTPALNEQAQDRIYRIGQSRGVVITRLVAAHALDRRIAELLAQKNEIINASVNAATRGADERVVTVVPTIDTAALQADSQRMADAQAAHLAAQQALVAMLDAAEKADQGGIEIDTSGTECPF